MTHESILKKLIEIQAEHSSPNVIGLINSLEKHIMNKKVTETTPKQKWTSIKQVLKNNKERPALNYINELDDYQIITDSTQLYILRKDDRIDDIPDEYVLPDELNYPDVIKLFKAVKSKSTLKYTINTAELKKRVKIADRYIDLEHFRINIDIIKNMLNIMQFKNKDDIVFRYSTDSRPVILKNKNTICLIAPVVKS